MIFGIILTLVAIIGIVCGICMIREERILKAVISIILSILIAVLGIFLIVKGFSSESFKRWTKDIQSEYDGGLYRTIQVVDKDGNTIKEYKGKMDIQENSGEKLVFVIDGKKYIIYNSMFNTVFVEESDEE